MGGKQESGKQEEIGASYRRGGVWQHDQMCWWVGFHFTCSPRH